MQQAILCACVMASLASAITNIVIPAVTSMCSTVYWYQLVMALVMLPVITGAIEEF